MGAAIIVAARSGVAIWREACSTTLQVRLGRVDELEQSREPQNETSLDEKVQMWCLASEARSVSKRM